MQPHPDTPTHLTTQEVCCQLRVSRATTAAYLRRGWLIGQRIGRAWLIERDSVVHLLQHGPDRQITP